MNIVLTACDREKDGFVAVAKWIDITQAAARLVIEAIDSLVDDDAEPRNASDAFAFILDLMDDKTGDMIDTGKRLLPTQLAMSLAPDQVSAWLKERPDPDCVINQRVPIVSNEILLRVAQGGNAA
ncbi:hypothetical protein GRI33_06150 [Brucella sp. BO3]|uniref:hypothetical protein n=1 Tax=unclassified Brucella TaxID=2632610 RepID=UPI00084F91E2|nr:MULTISPECIES: hypothetical protein [unclassified Brucella]OEI83698.1 hypothetical protein BA060_06895 [Brucella sp. B13-0095]QMV26531.1 hypothetical protein GRI33_06150 [Brucella sp. BO3]